MVKVIGQFMVTGCGVPVFGYVCSRLMKSESGFGKTTPGTVAEKQT